jgi:hypothetical protein|tara:strand:- start:1933 stop:2331 length:399 start_codon:yes stop_codon:yes gene_type:complete
MNTKSNQQDKVFMFFWYLIVFISILYYRSFYLDSFIYLILIATLPTLSLTFDSDISVWKSLQNRTSEQIKAEKKYYNKYEGDWRIKEGYDVKNKYIFLIIRFIKNLFTCLFIICTFISPVLLIIQIYNFIFK